MATKSRAKKPIALEEISLDDYSIAELEELINEAKKAIDQQQRQKVRELRKEFKQKASEVGLKIEEVWNYRKRKPRTGSDGRPTPPKYRNPDHPEQTWTGHGRRPQWFIDAEKRHGIEALLITSTADEHD